MGARVHGDLGRNIGNKGFGGLFNAKTLPLFQECPKLVMIERVAPLCSSQAHAGTWAWHSFGPLFSKAGKAGAWHPHCWQGTELG